MPNAEYVSARLTFKRDEIEPLKESELIPIHVSNERKIYRMTKAQFYSTFNNVVCSKSYQEIGCYNYGKTPSKAEQYLI